MKRTKTFKAILLAAITTLMFSVSAFAISDDPAHFEFEKYAYDLAPGDSIITQIYIGDDDPDHKYYDIFTVGNTDKTTYAWSDFKTGYTFVTINIGKNETAKCVKFHFYISGTDIHDCITVDVVNPLYSEVDKTRADAYKEKKIKDAETDELLKQYYAALERQKAREAAAAESAKTKK